MLISTKIVIAHILWPSKYISQYLAWRNAHPCTPGGLHEGGRYSIACHSRELERNFVFAKSERARPYGIFRFLNYLPLYIRWIYTGDTRRPPKYSVKLNKTSSKTIYGYSMIAFLKREPVHIYATILYLYEYEYKYTENGLDLVPLDDKNNYSLRRSWVWRWWSDGFRLLSLVV